MNSILAALAPMLHRETAICNPAESEAEAMGLPASSGNAGWLLSIFPKLFGGSDVESTAPRRVATEVLAASAFALIALGLFGYATAMAQIEMPPELGASAPEITLRASEFRASAASAPPASWISVPKLAGRLTRLDLGLVINTADPYSVEVGEFYARTRKLDPARVLRVELPLKPSLTPEEFRAFAAAVDAFFGASTQALALAWTTPFAVNCNSITGALALGYDASLCSHSCDPSRRSPYFNSATTRPFADLRMRPSMLLAAPNAAAAKELIRRGLASDRTLGLRGAPPVNVYFVNTPDKARSVRSVLFPPAGLIGSAGIDVHIEHMQTLENASRVLIYETGLAKVDKLDSIGWVPGALADHLTSTGGQLVGGGQMPALAWIASGATASYGTVSEPCNHLQKFPHPQILLLNYVQGSTAIEAYWRSVAWPQQGVFIGEPLAAPFSRR